MLPKNRKIKGEKYKRMNLSIKRHRSFISLQFQDDVIIFKKEEEERKNKTIICIKPLWEAGRATKKSKTKDGPVAGRRRSYDYCYYIYIHIRRS